MLKVESVIPPSTVGRPRGLKWLLLSSDVGASKPALDVSYKCSSGNENADASVGTVMLDRLPDSSHKIRCSNGVISAGGKSLTVSAGDVPSELKSLIISSLASGSSPTESESWSLLSTDKYWEWTPSDSWGWSTVVLANSWLVPVPICFCFCDTLVFLNIRQTAQPSCKFNKTLYQVRSLFWSRPHWHRWFSL